MSAQRYLATTQNTLAVSMARLSSGLRVNSAKDDAAGLAIAERMTSQIRGMNVGMRNANDGISMAQTAEGAMGKVGEIFQRMRELAVQATNATNSASDKKSLDTEFGELAKEVQRVYSNTTYNGLKILADDANNLVFQVGANTSSDNQITVTTTNMLNESSMEGVVGPVPTSSSAADAAAYASAVAATAVAVAAYAATQNATTLAAVTAAEALEDTKLAFTRPVLTGTTKNLLSVIDKIDSAISKVSNERSVLGASQSRFDSAISYLQISTENQTAAKSRIMDADFAQETANLSRAQILSQAGSAMLAQANQLPQSVMALLRG
jgi:flagellin